MLPLIDTAHDLLPAIFACFLIIAAVSDVRSYIIPNYLSVLVAFAYFLFALTGKSDPVVALIVAGAVFVFGIALFAANVMGGGDVKLLAATALWAGSTYIFPFLLVTALAGGVLSLAIILRPRLCALTGRTVTETAGDVPYGVAIASGGLLIAARLIGL